MGLKMRIPRRKMPPYKTAFRLSTSKLGRDISTDDEQDAHF